MISRADGGPWATTELVMLSATSRVRPTSRDSGAELTEGSLRAPPPPRHRPHRRRSRRMSRRSRKTSRRSRRMIHWRNCARAATAAAGAAGGGAVVGLGAGSCRRLPRRRRRRMPPSPVPVKARVRASPAMGRNSETVRNRSLRRRKVLSLVGMSNSRTRPSTNRRSTGRPMTKMRLVRGSGMIWTGVSSPAPPDPPAAWPGAPPGGAPPPSVRWTPAVLWVVCWAVSSSVSVVAISVTSANCTGMNFDDWTEPGTSMDFWSSIRLLMSEAFSVMTTAEAFGTAEMEP